MSKSFKLRNGLLLLSTEAPGGVYNSAQLKKIAALCDGDAALVKATEDQRLAVFVAPDKAAKVALELKTVGLGIRHYQDGLHQPVNCLGELCGEHLQDAMGTSMDLARELALTTLDVPLKIGINGCARCCVATHTLDISVIGDSSGYRISLGGKTSQIPEMASFMAEGVPAAKLPKLVAKVIAVYKELANKDETLQEVMERCGSTKFIGALAPYSQDAHQADPFAGIQSAASDPTDAKLAGLAPADDAGSEPDVGLEDVSGLDDGFDVDDQHAGGGAADSVDELALADEPAWDSSSAPPSGSDDDGLSDLEGAGLDADTFGTEPEAAHAFGDGDLAAEGDAGVPEIATVGDEELMLDDAGSLELGGGDMATEMAELADDLENTDSAAGDLQGSCAVGTETALEDDDGFGEADLSGDAAGGFAEEPLELLEEVGELTLPDEGPTLAEESLSGAAAAPPVPPAAPALKLAAPPVDDDFSSPDSELHADEAGEEEADLLEQKLNDSIAEEESFPESYDANSDSRLEAMKLVEASAGGTEAHDFDDLEINAAADGADPELAPSHASLPPPLPAPASPRPGKASPAPSSSSELTGIDVTGDGRVALQFVSGASIVLDARVLEGGVRRELRLVGKVVLVTPGNGGVHVEVDGVGVFLPKSAA